MRLLLDTCIVIELITDTGRLSKNVESLLFDADNQLYMSMESARELIIQFNNEGIVSRHWKTAKEMLQAISEEYCVTALPLQWEHMITYSDLIINSAQNHKDPSDHVIISHAITNHIPLISSDHKFPFYRKQGLDLIEN
ncbi:MAG: PIN domain-containing protein [Bacteroidaceae bacterium]|nr:PIN domain-containing protein [Bacteroidaceae bacterium]